MYECSVLPPYDLDVSNTLGVLQVQGLSILETTLSILADDVSATVHPNSVPPAKPFVSTTWTLLHKVIRSS